MNEKIQCNHVSPLVNWLNFRQRFKDQTLSTIIKLGDLDFMVNTPRTKANVKCFVCEEEFHMPLTFDIEKMESK